MFPPSWEMIPHCATFPLLSFSLVLKPVSLSNTFFVFTLKPLVKSKATKHMEVLSCSPPGNDRWGRCGRGRADQLWRILQHDDLNIICFLREDENKYFRKLTKLVACQNSFGSLTQISSVYFCLWHERWCWFWLVLLWRGDFPEKMSLFKKHIQTKGNHEE